MEKRLEKNVIKIVVTGPESTGKTNISDYLARELDAVWIPEYARYYVSSLREKYSYSDIEHIARKQIEDYMKYSGEGHDLVIFDTWLIITKVWFEVVFGKYPEWIDQKIEELPMDLYLLCSPDIPWEPDDVRENGNESRTSLFNRYKEEIEALDVPLRIISGSGPDRFRMALDAVQEIKQ